MLQHIPAKNLKSLTSLELEVLRYLNNHREAVLDMSIQELADATFVSTTTIIRMCKKLGLEGYSHLKYFLKELLKKKPQPVYAGHTIESLVEEELQDIYNTAQLIEHADISAVAALMHQANQIHFFARGLTEVVFEYSVRHLQSLSKHVALYHDNHIAFIQADRMGESDLVFLASLSGETEQVIRVAQVAQSRGAKIVTFTANATSRLAQLGDYHFLLVNNATTTLDVDTKSRCQLLFVLTILIKVFVQQNQSD
ncbi:MAG: MurR/RpiR family transcriptional regulator [Clostridiaceae bacterium]|nr:MurR/RpiR family transcriptional regulator [Clostridiaceae bacterium]